MQAAHYIFQSIASSTRRTYSSGERHFIRFCLFHKLISPQTPFLPTSESTLIHFVTHLSNTVSYGTIKVYLAAVKNLHVEFGCPLDFSSMPFLYKTLRGIKSSLGIAKRARFPITISILRQIYAKLKPFQSLDTDSSMLWAAFTLAFFGFLRSSEFTYNGKFNIQSHLTRSDVHFYPNIVQPVSFEVVIKKSKTDPFRETAKLTIAKSNSTVCAVTALRDYLLQTNPSGATQPLFQFSDGRHLTRSSLTNNLRALLKVCGLDSTCYASHSFRIGAATTAGAAGLPDWLIKVLGRWKSDAYQSYSRTYPKKPFSKSLKIWPPVYPVNDSKTIRCHIAMTIVHASLALGTLLCCSILFITNILMLRKKNNNNNNNNNNNKKQTTWEHYGVSLYCLLRTL